MSSERADELACQSQPFASEACSGLDFFREHEGARYCVLHYPANDKLPDFDAVARGKLERQDFNFHSVWFPAGTQTHFRGVTFTSAVFNAAVFQDTADFHGASFEETAYFSGVKFEGDASFGSAVFKSIADFRYASVRKCLDFTYATFHTYLYVEGAPSPQGAGFANPVFGNGASLKFYLSRMEKPERISFRALRLEPHWFSDVDARKFEFENVAWDEKAPSDDAGTLVHPRPYSVLSVANRHLATNAEENNRFAEASRFRYASMEARRRPKYAIWQLTWWYWAMSGYGERPARALLMLALTVALFAAAYTQTTFGGTPRVGLAPVQAIAYSVEVALLQKPDPRPATASGRILTALETVLGPLQGGLLALAIRRKFMR